MKEYAIDNYNISFSTSREVRSWSLEYSQILQSALLLCAAFLFYRFKSTRTWQRSIERVRLAIISFRRMPLSLARRCSDEKHQSSADNGGMSLLLGILASISIFKSTDETIFRCSRTVDQSILRWWLPFLSFADTNELIREHKFEKAEPKMTPNDPLSWLIEEWGHADFGQSIRRELLVNSETEKHILTPREFQGVAIEELWNVTERHRINIGQVFLNVCESRVQFNLIHSL